ncbi:MAG: AMP-binding protein [Pseudomonadota bacterium]
MPSDLSAFQTYADARAGFRWAVPRAYNIAAVCCDVWAARDPSRSCLVLADERGAPTPVSYGALLEGANRLANVLTARGVGRGTRVAIQLGQRLETVLAHLAVYKCGAIAVPIAAVFGPDAIVYRVETAGARCLITTAENAERLGERPLDVLVVDGPPSSPQNLAALMERASPDAPTAATGPDDPAMMIFTSGTTGQPKGALHGHRVLLGHVPGVQMHHDLLPQAGDRLWTPADWAWAGGLLNVLLPGLALGVPVVAQRAERFDAEEALDWAAEAGVRNAFIPPTALRLMRQTRPSVRLRSIGSGGEQLGAETFQWAKSRLGVTVNEFYGQSECNLVLSSCSAWGIATPGVIGRPVPGHSVAVVDGNGHPVADGEPGTIAVAAPDPVMFLGYWNDRAATMDKFRNGYLMTGDQGVRGPDGVSFVGRDDDVITSAGYRIGPGEIEDCLVAHPDVALAAVVGKPDPLRTEVVAAYVVLREGATPSDALVEAIKAHVRERLSAHEYPRVVTFVDDIPLTTTGKVIRRHFRAHAKGEA